MCSCCLWVHLWVWVNWSPKTLMDLEKNLLRVPVSLSLPTRLAKSERWVQLEFWATFPFHWQNWPWQKTSNCAEWQKSRTIQPSCNFHFFVTSICGYHLDKYLRSMRGMRGRVTTPFKSSNSYLATSSLQWQIAKQSDKSESETSLKGSPDILTERGPSPTVASPGSVACRFVQRRQMFYLSNNFRLPNAWDMSKKLWFGSWNLPEFCLWIERGKWFSSTWYFRNVCELLQCRKKAGLHFHKDSVLLSSKFLSPFKHNSQARKNCQLLIAFGGTRFRFPFQRSIVFVFGFWIEFQRQIDKEGESAQGGLALERRRHCPRVCQSERGTRHWSLEGGEVSHLAFVHLDTPDLPISKHPPLP